MATPDHHAESNRTYYAVFGALLGLTVLTVIAAYFHFGHLNDVIAMAIAGTKAALVIVFFMHVRRASGLTRLFLFSGFAWLALLMIFTFADLLSRSLVTPAH